MDFEVTYTPEQEAFRAEVRAWLADNIPEGLEVPIDAGSLSYEQYQKSRELGRRLGAKGWLYPTYPKEYGGGDLSVDFVMILEEELDRYDMSLPPYYDSGGRLGGASIFVWGSEEQKQAFLPHIFRGEWRTWQLLTEPNAGSDLAGVQTRAVRDGDEYVVNGQKNLYRQPARMRDDVDHCRDRSRQAAPRKSRLVAHSLRYAGRRGAPDGTAHRRWRRWCRIGREKHRIFR
jgi:alkylation response protein AidB-like acyl-CoA dehydrogenase